METWNSRLRIALKARRRIAADLAAVTGKKSASVSGWLTGATKMMDADNSVIVCDYLRIKPMWLFFGKGPSGLEDATLDLDTQKRIAGSVENDQEDNLYPTPEISRVAQLMRRLDPDIQDLATRIVEQLAAPRSARHEADVVPQVDSEQAEQSGIQQHEQRSYLIGTIPSRQIPGRKRAGDG